MRRAIFLDRDGTLNKAIVKNGLPFSPPSFSEFEILPGVKESLLKLKKLNFVCLLVTNQPDVSRGKIKKSVVKIPSSSKIDSMRPASWIDISGTKWTVGVRRILDWRAKAR